MRTAIAIALLQPEATPALRHFCRIANLEIVHPAPIVPQSSSDCTCADVTIINHGSEAEYFLGADIAIVGSTKLLRVVGHDHDISAPSVVPITSGSTYDLHRNPQCMLLNTVTQSVEADVGAYPARPRFRHSKTIDVEFMVDADQL